MLQQPVSHSRRFNSRVETRSIGVVARVTTGYEFRICAWVRSVCRDTKVEWRGFYGQP